MKKVFTLLALSLLFGCTDRTKIELENGEGKLVEVKVDSGEWFEFDFDTFVKLTKQTSAEAKRQCNNATTYIPTYSGIMEWDRDTKVYKNDYTPKGDVVTILFSFFASNSFGVKSEEIITRDYEDSGNGYKDVTEKIKAVRAEMSRRKYLNKY